MSATTTHTPSPALIVLFWLYVGIPLALGIWETLLKASALFHSRAAHGGPPPAAPYSPLIRRNFQYSSPQNTPVPASIAG